MTVLRFRPPVTQPLHRKGYPRPATGPGADDFRVTQQFHDPDFYWLDKDPAKAALGHRATDIGNGRCNYPIVAMAPGVLARIKDNATAYGAPNDALGVRVTHEGGVVTEVWHLNSYAGAQHGQRVAAGDLLGYHGSTGLGQVCHAHITARVNGVLIDPEPLMFGATLTIGSTPQEEDMRFGGAELKIIGGSKDAHVLDSNSHLRSGPSRASASLGVLPAGTVCYGSFTVDGESIGGNDQWLPTFQYVNNAYHFGFYHTSLLTEAPEPATAPVPVDCSAAVNAERSRWLTWLASKPK